MSKHQRPAEHVQTMKARMVPITAATPVRFMADGCAVNILTGEKDPKGINVMHQTAYWRFDRETAKEIAVLTNTRPEFDR